MALPDTVAMLQVFPSISAFIDAMQFGAKYLPVDVLQSYSSQHGRREYVL